MNWYTAAFEYDPQGSVVGIDTTYQDSHGNTADAQQQIGLFDAYGIPLGDNTGAEEGADVPFALFDQIGYKHRRPAHRCQPLRVPLRSGEAGASPSVRAFPATRRDL